MTQIHILSTFLKAGLIYNWEGEPAGIGIQLKEYRGEGDLRITLGVNRKVLLIDKAKAREFIIEHRSTHTAEGTKLGVVPRYMFREEKELISNLDTNSKMG